MNGSHKYPLLGIKFIVAFCSLSYELILAQTLSVFLSNMVLRYCVTIGLYMFAMGMGALWVDRQREHDAVSAFWRVEVLLTLLGMLFLPSLFLVSALFADGVVFVCWAHLLICVIGFLTGQELPWLWAIDQLQGGHAKVSLMVVDYLGAFAGTVVFAFWFYPCVGLFTAVWAAVLLNALSMLFFALGWRGTKTVRMRLGIAIGMVLLASFGLITAGVQAELLGALY